MSKHKKTCCRGGAHQPMRCYCPCDCIPRVARKPEKPSEPMFALVIKMDSHYGNILHLLDMNKLGTASDSMKELIAKGTVYEITEWKEMEVNFLPPKLLEYNSESLSL